MPVPNSRGSDASTLNTPAADAAKMRGAPAGMSAAKVRTAAPGITTAAFGESGVGCGNQQHADRNDRGENAAFASHEVVPPMANEPKLTFSRKFCSMRLADMTQ